MGTSKSAEGGSPGVSRVDLAVALRGRLEEIAATILTRVHALPGIYGVGDPVCIAAIGVAVAEAIQYTVDEIEGVEGWPAGPPDGMKAAARGAARDRVSLDAVLRCCTTGDRVLSEFMVQLGGGLEGDVLGEAFRSQARALDRLMKAVAAEYGEEAKRIGSSALDRAGAVARRLLAEEPVDRAKLGYELDGWHLGLILSGAAAGDLVKRLAGLGYALLQVPTGSEAVWVWLGSGRRRVGIGRVEKCISSHGAADVTIAIGELGHGLDGWRLTHAQAKAALRVSQCRPRSVTRYADVLLLSAALQDSVLARSLSEIYLSPLGSKNNGGVALRETLRAYFACGHNVKASAARLRVDRGTVSRRIRLVEERLGRSLLICQAELEVALRLDELTEISHKRHKRCVRKTTGDRDCAPGCNAAT